MVQCTNHCEPCYDKLKLFVAMIFFTWLITTDDFYSHQG